MRTMTCLVGRSVGVALLALGLFPAVASGQTQPAPQRVLRFTDTPLAVGFVLGIGTPVGEIGGTAEYSFSDRLAAGIGVGTSNVGVQVAASGRLRLALYQGPGVAHAFDFVAAFASGRYQGGIFLMGDNGYWDERAYWVQGSLDYEVLRSGFRFATGFGFAQLVGSSDAKQVCVDYCPKAPRDLWPTMHVTIGFAI